MAKYQCTLCNKTFLKKTTFKSHLEKERFNIGMMMMHGQIDLDEIEDMANESNIKLIKTY